MSSQRHKIYTQGVAANGEDTLGMGFSPEPIDPAEMVEYGHTPDPFLDSLAPTEVPKTGATFTVNGRMFENTDAVFIDNKPVASVFMSTVRFLCTISSADNLSPGVHKVTVGNAARRSNQQNLMVV